MGTIKTQGKHPEHQTHSTYSYTEFYEYTYTYLVLPPNLICVREFVGAFLGNNMTEQEGAQSFTSPLGFAFTPE